MKQTATTPGSLVLPGGHTLLSGRTLEPIEVAYETFGTLDADKANAILVCHALSGDSHVASAGTAQVHRQAGELLPLAFAPWLASVFGVQLTLMAGGVTVALVALLALREAGAIDRAARAHPRPDVEVATLITSDEPISPNR